MKYTVEVYLKKTKATDGSYIHLPNRIYRQVEANNEVGAKQKVVAMIDPNLEIENVQVIDT